MGTPIPNLLREKNASIGASKVKVFNVKDMPEEERKKYENKTPVLTREKYIEHKENHMSDSEIRKLYGIKSTNELTNWKRANGLENYRLPTSPMTPNNQAANKNSKANLVEDKHSGHHKLSPETVDRIVFLEKSLKEAEAKAEQLQRELDAVINSNDVYWFDPRTAALELLQTGKLAVRTREEFNYMIDVLDALKLPWTADYDSAEYTISHKCI